MRSARFLWELIPGERTDLLRLDARLFDDRTPSLDFRLKVCAQRLRRGVGEGGRHSAEISHPRIESRVLDCSPQGGIEFIEGRYWSSARRPHAVPNDYLESLHALLVQSRQLW